MKPEELKIGEYHYTPEMTVKIIRGKNIVVVTKSRRRVVTDVRCYRCKWYQQYYSTNAIWKTTVCMKRPKEGRQKTSPSGEVVQLYYRADRYDHACAMFEEREDNE